MNDKKENIEKKRKSSIHRKKVYIKNIPTLIYVVTMLYSEYI